MTLTLPDKFLELFDEHTNPEAEARTRLAAQFYTDGKVSLGKGADLAELKRWEFEKWLQDHAVHIPWSEVDLVQEIASADKQKDFSAS